MSCFFIMEGYVSSHHHLNVFCFVFFCQANNIRASLEVLGQLEEQRRILDAEVASVMGDLERARARERSLLLQAGDAHVEQEEALAAAAAARARRRA